MNGVEPFGVAPALYTSELGGEVEMRTMRWLVGAAVFLTAACGGTGSEGGDSMALRALVERQMTEYLVTDPELSSSVSVSVEQAGGPYAHRLVDFSPAAEQNRRALFARFLSELEAVDEESLDTNAKVTLDVARSIYGSMVASFDIGYGRQYPFWYYGHTPYVVNQISGPHIDIPNLMANQQGVSSVAEAADYLARLAAFGPAFDGIIEKIRADADIGVTPPRVLLERALEVVDGILATEPANHDLVTTLAVKLEEADLPDSDRERILSEATTQIAETVLPAYRRLRDTLASLVPQARTESGVWALPNGEAFYRAAVRALGGSDLDPDEVHDIGLAEVDRITAQIDALLRDEGLTDGTVGERLVALAEDPRFLYPDSDEGRERLIADLNAQVVEISERMPEYFNTIPPQPVEVRRVPVFSEATAPGGYYDGPSLDGTRPGYYNVNLRDMTTIASWTLNTLTYHEAVPGHHHQVATALASGDQPLVRKLSPLNAYAEGWALYSEQLAWEMGLYEDDPFGDVGRLSDELFRAVRLVVDTGLHHKRWTREEAIDYMAKTTGSPASEVRAEIERYMAWPGQALGYKLGMLRILELREGAKERLGEAFDIRRFHDVVLLGGAVPMDVLERLVDAWVESGGG